MTRERIEDMREVVLPFVKKRLLETNYEGLGKSDAEEFTRDFNEILELAIKALEQEPCEDAVSRKAVINQIFYSTDNSGDVVLGSALRERIEELPSVTPQTRKGHWIECMPGGAEEWCYKCSECNFWKYKKTINLSKFKFCPNCGAKMIEPQESEDKLVSQDIRYTIRYRVDQEET